MPFVFQLVYWNLHYHLFDNPVCFLTAFPTNSYCRLPFCGKILGPPYRVVYSLPTRKLKGLACMTTNSMQVKTEKFSRTISTENESMSNCALKVLHNQPANSTMFHCKNVFLLRQSAVQF